MQAAVEGAPVDFLTIHNASIEKGSAIKKAINGHYYDDDEEILIDNLTVFI